MDWDNDLDEDHEVANHLDEHETAHFQRLTSADADGDERAVGRLGQLEGVPEQADDVAGADLVLHVVDGSHPDPESQISAVREVLSEVLDEKGADSMNEIIVINKADAADPEVVARLLRTEKRSIAVSARTGQGITELCELVESELPRPDIEVDVVVPYERGDLVARIHSEGEVLAVRTDTRARHHDEVLLALVEETLQAAGVTRGELTGVVVGRGPGPFTGLRVGLVSARSIASVLGVPLHGLSSLDALAHQALAAVPA